MTMNQDEVTGSADLVTGMTVKVVLLRQLDARTVPMLGVTPVDFAASELDPVLVAELVDSATVLDAPAGVPEEVVRALRYERVPAVFARSPWLHEHRALRFTDGKVPVGGHTLRYHEEIGVYVGEDA